MPQARFCIQAVFLFTILIFCMVQLFRQVEDKAVYMTSSCIHMTWADSWNIYF